MKTKPHTIPVTNNSSLSINGWIVELKQLAQNYPRVPNNGARHISVERIITARRLGEPDLSDRLNDGLAAKMKEVGLL